MSNSLLAMLPVHITCQIICGGNYSVNNSTLGVNSTDQNEVTVIPDGYTHFPNIGVAYKFFNYKRPWNEARKLCIEEGGNLAIIDTFKKIEYIMGIKSSDAGPYIGIHRFFDREEWVSVKTGLPVTVNSWAPDRNIGQSEKLCLIMWSDGRGVTADLCDEIRNFVCEIPISAN